MQFIIRCQSNAAKSDIITATITVENLPVYKLLVSRRPMTVIVSQTHTTKQGK